MIVTIICLIGAIVFYIKRSNLLKLADAAESVMEKEAFRRSADNQIWKILIFGIPGAILLIMWIAVLLNAN